MRTNSQNQDFIHLVKLLDQDLAIKDGDDHAFYSQFNKIHSIKYVVIVLIDGMAVGCGAIKEYNSSAMEVKRMFVLPEKRGGGVATRILHELEQWSVELGYTKCILETGKRQADAVRLYRKNGYQVTTNYGHYAGIENSICFEKDLHK